MGKAINIIIDWTKSNDPGFIEIENDNGKSIRIGTQSKLETEDGDYIKIRITSEDIEKHPKCIDGVAEVNEENAIDDVKWRSNIQHFLKGRKNNLK